MNVLAIEGSLLPVGRGCRRHKGVRCAGAVQRNMMQEILPLWPIVNHGFEYSQ